MSQFEQAFSDSSSWYRQAQHLLAGARILATELREKRVRPNEQWTLEQINGCLKGSLLMLAYATENALKAVVIARSPPSVNNGWVEKGAVFGGRDGHNLVQLAEKAGISLDSAETDLLSRLSTVGAWAGKYQFPLDQASYDHSKQDNPRQLRHPDDVEMVARIVNKAGAYLANQGNQNAGA